MFFYLSKFLWFIVQPGNLIFIGLIVGVVLLWTPLRNAGRRLLTVTTIIVICIAVFPIGQIASQFYEDRFSKPAAMPTNIDGIIVLGGVISPALSVSRNELSFGSATERITAFAALAHQYPDAKLIFTGGTGDPFNPSLSESKMIRPFLADLGMNIEGIIFENESRNTVENAQLTYKLVDPKQNETWLLITSAFHMPRAMGCFRKAGWRNITAYPVDFGTSVNADTPLLQFDLTRGLNYLNAAMHEGLGLLFYYLTGKTDTLLPGPHIDNKNTE